MKLSGLARGRWLLGPRQEAHNERRITAIMGGVRRNLVIDRMFRDTDRTLWIADYKTSSHEGTGIEEFLNREQERYRAQLQRYAAALPGQEQVRLGLYFPLLSAWREFPAGK